MRFREKKEYYSLRKFKGVGLASALVGLSFMSQGVLAEETPAVSPSSGGELATVTNSTSESESGRVVVVPKDSVVSSSSAESSSSSVVEKKVEDNIKPLAAEEDVSIVKPSSEAIPEVKPVLEVAPVVNSTDKVSSELNATSISNESSVASETTKPNSGSTEVAEHPESRSSEKEAVSNDSVQPARSRRGKRDVSSSEESTTGNIKLFGLDGDNATLVPATGREVVTAIDYTDGSNPQKAPVGDNYNNQISKVEILNTSMSRVRVRVSLVDGETIPEGGKIQLASLGASSFDSNKLLMNSTVVGSGTISDRSPNNKLSPRKELESSLKSATTVEEYLSILKGLKRFDYPVSMINLTMNSSFSSYNKNRVLEFDLTTSSTIYDSLALKSEDLSKDGIYNSVGSLEKPSKETMGYIINPYDNSKIMNLRPFSGGASVNTPYKDSRPVNDNLKMSDSQSFNVSSLPYFLTSANIYPLNGLEINGGVPSSTRNRLSAGDYIKTSLTNDSIFKSDISHKVGDVVEVSVRNSSPSKISVESSQRFSDTDKYVVEKITNTGYSYEDTKVRLRLVELTDTTIKWELLDDVKLTKGQLYMGLNREFFNYSLREDWISRFGKDSLLNYLKSGGNPSKYTDKSKFKLTSEFSENGTPHSKDSYGSISRNPNIVWGDKFTGSVKVKYVLDTGELLKEVNLVENQPWDTRTVVDLPEKFGEAMLYSTSETGLPNTFVGIGNRIITVTYKTPVSEDISETPPTKKYVLDSSKEGTYRNEVEGTPNKVVRTVTYKFNKDSGWSEDVEDYIDVPGTPTVVTLGAKPTTEVTYQDFSTTYVADPTRTAGEKFTETAGVRGTTTTETTYSVNKETGVVTPTKGQPVVVAPRNAVVKVGTKPTVTETPVNFTTVYEADETKGKGVRTDKVAGVNGKVLTTTTYTLDESTGNVTANSPAERREEPTNKVVTVGTAPTVTTNRIAHGVEYQRDDTVSASAAPKRVQDGVDGERRTTTTYSVNPTTGTITENKPVETTVASKPQIEKLGTKPEDIVTTQDFKRTFVADETKDLGYHVVETKGVQGKTVVHRTYTLPENVPPVEDNGQAINYEFAVAIPHDSEPVVTAPVNEVTRVGVKPKVETEPIAVTTKYIADENLEFGKVVETEKGSEGRVVTTTTYTMNPTDGTTVANKPTVDTTPMVQRVVKVGVKKKVVETPIEFTTRYERDEEVEAGKKTPSVSGIAGKTITTTTYTMNPTTGVVTENPSTTVREEPTTAVVKVGTKSKVATEVLSKTTRYEVDPTKVKGETEVVEQGSDGSVVTTTPYVLNEKDGSVSEGKSTTVRTEPKERVIKVGTQPKVVVEKVEKTNRYEADPTKAKGEKETSVEGSDGSVTTTTPYVLNKEKGSVTEGTPIVEKIPAVERVVKIGTQPKVEETPLPFTTSYEADPSADKGSTSDKVVGKGGKVTTTTTYSVDPKTGEVSENPSTSVREEPVNRVVSVGSKPTTVVTEQEYSTRYVGDSSKEVGFKETREKGGGGTTSVTTTYSVDPTSGKITPKEGSPVVVTPKEEVIALGNKSKVEVETLHKTTRYEKDSEKDKGVSTTSVEGSDGSKTTTTTYTVNSKTGEVTPSTPNVETVPAVEKVVKVGAKDKVEVTPIPSPVRYEGDTSVEKGSPNKEIKGVDGSSTVTTTYSVDSKTGFVTETVGTPVVVKATETVIKVGAKSKVVVTPNPVEVEEVDDPDLFEGDENVTSKGKAGSTTTTTEYVVNPTTGEITEKDPVVSTIPMEKKVVHKGTKKRKATVTISYVLKDNGSALGSPTVLENQQVGSPYNTSVKVFEPKVEVSELADRTVTKTTSYVLEKEPENKSGIVTEQGVSVVYTYRALVREEVVMKESKLTVNFVLEGSGEKLHESLVKEGVRVGDPYVTEPLALKDKVEKRVERNKEVVTTTKYEVVETPKNARGLIEVGGTSVTFTYRAVVSSEEYPTIPSEAPKVDEVEYAEPIHVNGPVETLALPEFTGGVNPYDAPIYEKPELKVEEPTFKPILGDSFPKKEVPVEVPNKVSDSEKEKPLSPREEKPSVDGLETPKQVLTSNSSQKPQNAPDSISISQVEKVTPNYLTSPKQAHSGSEQVLPNTGGSESDNLASLSGIGLLGLLGLAGLRKSKED